MNIFRGCCCRLLSSRHSMGLVASVFGTGTTSVPHPELGVAVVLPPDMGLQLVVSSLGRLSAESTAGMWERRTKVEWQYGQWKGRSPANKDQSSILFQPSTRGPR